MTGEPRSSHSHRPDGGRAQRQSGILVNNPATRGRSHLFEPRGPRTQVPTTRAGAHATPLSCAVPVARSGVAARHVPVSHNCRRRRRPVPVSPRRREGCAVRACPSAPSGQRAQPGADLVPEGCEIGERGSGNSPLNSRSSASASRHGDSGGAILDYEEALPSYCCFCLLFVVPPQPVRLLVNDRKFSVENNVFFSHQTSQQ